MCSLGWSEIKHLLKGQSFQVEYGSMIFPEQLLSKTFGLYVIPVVFAACFN